MPVDELRERLDRLAGPDVDVDAGFGSVMRRNRRRRARRVAIGLALVVAVVAAGSIAVQDRDDDASRVEIVDRPTDDEALTVVTAPSPVQRPGEMPPEWHEAFAIPYGDGDDELGVDKWGPEYPAPGPDGTWWVLDVNKSRVARFDASGSFLGDVAFPNGGGFQRPHVLGDHLVASAGAGGRFLVATGDVAREVDVDGVPERATFPYSDGTSVFSDEGVAIAVEGDELVTRPASAFRTPSGERFTRFIEGSTIVIELLDAHKRVEVDVAPLEPKTFFIETVADIAGTIHVLVVGVGDDDTQVAGYFTVGSTGRVSIIEPIREPFSDLSSGSPGQLQWIPGTTTVALSFVDDDALRVFTRDDGDPRTQDDSDHVIEEVVASRQFSPRFDIGVQLVVAPDGALWAAIANEGIYEFDDEMSIVRSIEDIDPNVYVGGVALTDDGTIVSTGVARTDVPKDDGDGMLTRQTLFSIDVDGTVSEIAPISEPMELFPSAPQVADGRAFVAVEGHLTSVRLDDGTVDRTDELPGLGQIVLVDDEVLAIADDGVHHFAVDGLDARGVPWKGGRPNDLVVVDGVTWIAEQMVDPTVPTPHRLDGSATMQTGPWGDVLGIAGDHEVLWSAPRNALAAFDPESGDVIAWRTLDNVFGTMATSGRTVWLQDAGAGNVIRRYELRPRA